MRSFLDPEFLVLYRALPADIRRQARAAYQRFKENPQHPGLRFNRVRTRSPLYSARVNDSYRVLGLLEGDEITWFWIGSHADYDRYLATL